jgi:hypothetical protein
MFLTDLYSEKNIKLNSNNNIDESDFKSISKLLKAMCYDPILNKKLINILKLDSYQRHIVLSNWLEQLRRNDAPKRLIQTLTYLFDDTVAEKVFGLINRSKDKRDIHSNK